LKVVLSNNYNKWNKVIFEYFFNAGNAGIEVLFAVNKEIIEKLGKKINTSNPYEDFCKSVSEEIIAKDKNGNYLIKLSNFIKRLNDEIPNDGIPSQSALIAFFILAASNMGQDSEYRKNAYYPELAKLSKKYYAPIIEGIRSNESDLYFQLFDEFASYLNNKLNKSMGRIFFHKLFIDRPNRDRVGIPIFQSMLSEKLEMFFQ
jgi:hypothetical protein